MKYLLIFLILSLSACAHVSVNDHEYCGDMGSLGASCFHFLTPETRDVPKDQWDNMRFGQICTNDPDGQQGATFADLKATIEKLCSISKNCDYPPMSTHIQNFFKRVERFNALQRASKQ